MFSSISPTQYVVLRYRSDLRSPVKGDFDIALKPHNFYIVFEKIKEAARKHSMTCRIASNRYYGKCIFVYKADTKFFLKLDIHFSEVWKYIETTTLSALFEGIWVDQNGAKRLAVQNEVYLKLVFYFLNGAKLPVKYEHLYGSDINACLNNNLPNFAVDFFGKKISANETHILTRYSYILLSVIYLVIVRRFDSNLVKGYFRYLYRRFTHKQFEVEFRSELTVEDLKEWSNILLPGLQLSFNGSRRCINPKINLIDVMNAGDSHGTIEEYYDSVVTKILDLYEYKD